MGAVINSKAQAHPGARMTPQAAVVGFALAKSARKRNKLLAAE